MRMKKINREILAWPERHPARQFLEAFMACRRDCVGREIDFKDPSRVPIDQRWLSPTDGKLWTFSSFAYQFLSFTLVLDGWLSSASAMTDTERMQLHQIPVLRRLMHECEASALKDGNHGIVELVRRVLNLLDLWERCIRQRVTSTDELPRE
jgi:hypothetical protein